MTLDQGTFAAPLSVADLGSPKLFVIAGKPEFVLRAVRKPYAGHANLVDTREMLMSMVKSGCGVPEHAFVEIHSGEQIGAFILAERLRGKLLIHALVEGTPGAVVASLNLIESLASYYGSALRSGGIFPTDFYGSDFLFGRSDRDEHDRAYLVDIDPLVHRFDPNNCTDDDADTIFSQTDALVHLLMMVENVSERHQSTRTVLAELYAKMGRVFPGSSERCSGIARALRSDPGAVVALASDAPLKNGERAEEAMRWDLPPYVDEASIAKYVALLSALERTGLCTKIYRYSGREAVREGFVGRPLVVALSHPDAARATGEFLERIAAFFEGLLETGGDYPLNVWSQRLVYGNIDGRSSSVVTLADPYPMSGTLDLCDRQSLRRFAAFSNELIGVLLDAEELSGETLPSARRSIERLLERISACDDELRRKATTALALFRRQHRTPIQYWMT